MKMLESGESVRRQCTCCGEWFEIFALETSMSLFTCIACWYDLVGERAAMDAVQEIRVKTCGPEVSQACESRTDV